MDRFLVSPIWRGALNAGSVAQNVIIIAIQSLIVTGLSLAVGGHFPNGLGGVAILIGLSALLGASFASPLQRPRPGRPPTRNIDRRGHLDHAAAHLPLNRLHAANPRSRLDPLDRKVQPGQLGSVLTMDCDFSHDPHDVPRLIAASQEADVILGSRSAAGGIDNRTFGRRLISTGGSLYARTILGLPVRDATAGFALQLRPRSAH